MPAIQNVLTDYLVTKTLQPKAGERDTDEVVKTWDDGRFLIGWNPWLGCGCGTIMEAHLLLFKRTPLDGGGSKDTRIFLRGPHKEAATVMYDLGFAEFFPAGYGVFVGAGEQIILQFLLNNDSGGWTPGYGGQAQCHLFTVPV